MGPVVQAPVLPRASRWPLPAPTAPRATRKGAMALVVPVARPITRVVRSVVVALTVLRLRCPAQVLRVAASATRMAARARMPPSWWSGRNEHGYPSLRYRSAGAGLCLTAGQDGQPCRQHPGHRHVLAGIGPRASRTVWRRSGAWPGAVRAW